MIETTHGLSSSGNKLAARTYRQIKELQRELAAISTLPMDNRQSRQQLHTPGPVELKQRLDAATDAASDHFHANTAKYVEQAEAERAFTNTTSYQNMLDLYEGGSLYEDYGLRPRMTTAETLFLPEKARTEHEDVAAARTTMAAFVDNLYETVRTREDDAPDCIYLVKTHSDGSREGLEVKRSDGYSSGHSIWMDIAHPEAGINWTAVRYQDESFESDPLYEAVLHGGPITGQPDKIGYLTANTAKTLVDHFHDDFKIVDNYTYRQEMY